MQLRRRLQGPAGDANLQPVRLSTSDRLVLAFFGVVVGGISAWLAWQLVSWGELMVGVSVSGLAGMGALALWSAVWGR